MDGTDEPMIRLDGVGKTYPDGTVAVQELDLDVPRGEMVVPRRPVRLRQVHDAEDGQPADRADAAAASSSTARTSPTADPVALRRRIGYVIQQVGLFPHQTIRTNVATVPRLLGWDRKAGASRAPRSCSTWSGSTRPQYADRYPAPALRRPAAARRRGPGARRRPAGAADGRAVRRGRPDRPRPGCRTSSCGSSATSDKTVMFVTHDIDEAVRLGDRIAVFADRRPARAVRRPGRGSSAGPPTTSSPSSSAPAAACAGSR